MVDYSALPNLKMGPLAVQLRDFSCANLMNKGEKLSFLKLYTTDTNIRTKDPEGDGSTL